MYAIWNKLTESRTVWNWLESGNKLPDSPRQSEVGLESRNKLKHSSEKSEVGWNQNKQAFSHVPNSLKLAGIEKQAFKQSEVGWERETMA